MIAGRGVVRAWTMEISIGQGNEEPLEAFKWGETGWELPFGVGHGTALARGKLGQGRRNSEKKVQSLGESYKGVN